MKYLLKISYDGAFFAGFQRQPRVKTIQEELEKALSLTLDDQIRLTCAGRTDKGVHARGQIVSLKTTSDGPIVVEALKQANGSLAPSIRILQAVECPPGFHPRHSAVHRTYTYDVATAENSGGAAVWCLGREVDLGEMRKAARIFTGRHDFTSFSYRCGTEGNVRRLDRIDVALLDGRLLRITIQGNGFLRKMVRLVVAGIVGCGLGRYEVTQLAARLEKKDPAQAPHPAPAHALCLDSVGYEMDPFLLPSACSLA